MADEVLLTINCGSSTVKFGLFDVMDSAQGVVALGHGKIERIGGKGAIEFAGKGEKLREEASVKDYGEGVRLTLEWMQSRRLLKPSELHGVAHRVVHGGERFVEPTRIDDKVMRAIEELSELAPLHNEPALQAMRAAREILPSAPMVAVFDTAFHHHMPPLASRYAIDQDMAARHQIRRYGFHGLAHRYMVERYASITSTPMPHVDVITLQLGNGCSAAAISKGRSMDTSMGFTPLEGLVMGARSGDVDPTLAGFIAKSEAVPVEEVENWLNTRSGLLGVSGLGQDMRKLLGAEEKGNEKAGLAIEMFCYRVRKYIGAYLAVLGGAKALIFGGGIGENEPEIRRRICAGMEWCGLRMDEGRNKAAVGVEARITSDDASLQAYVIPVDEASVMARDAWGCLGGQARSMEKQEAR